MKRLRTIKDLAELAEVSTGTVSRALAGSTLISSRTRERIQALAEEHKFKPNLLARNLRTQRTAAIGVLVPLPADKASSDQTLADPSLGIMLSLLADAFAARDYDLLLRRIPTNSPGWLADYVDSGRVDGVVLLGEAGEGEAIDEVAERFLPLVAWGAKEQGRHHCTVGSDYLAGGQLAGRHMIERGSRRIAFCGELNMPETVQRLEGVRQVVAEAGGEIIEIETGSGAGPRTLIADALADGPVPDGIIAGSDLVAMSALRVCAERQVAVPGTVRLIGFGGLEIAAQTTPPLTTVRQDFEGMAAALVDTLLRRIRGEDAPPVVCSPELVVRGST